MTAPVYASHRSTLAKKIGLGRKPDEAPAEPAVEKLPARRARRQGLRSAVSTSRPRLSTGAGRRRARGLRGLAERLLGPGRCSGYEAGRGGVQGRGTYGRPAIAAS
jgi:hypothetical protein